MPLSLCVVAALSALLTLAAVPGRAGAEEAGPTNLPPSIRIKPLMLPVLTPDGRVEKYAQMEVTLELADAAALLTAQGNTPKLQDAILGELYNAISAGWIIRGNIANAAALRKRLDEAGEAVVGKDKVTRVLITPTARQSAWP
ncbi:hypothetical protein HL658_24710 [Azospirillum sp. RWY-5-1]|uniref:Flagellar protein FliL n=1 Tax=Azospirillum oleiclasticum TaxID=2735135 RepID=A0ABX2TFD2_9PROT|nr:hypothetical protein [Azospirillum oleiclasticum]NYZ15756.1 hypothetical protein [Azospirillum oleiclasticum]NYZ22026.1 hypothetical protein [Azospirillum oleiclasticum]